MPTEPSQSECMLQDDARLIAAVGAMVSHASQRIGLSDEAQTAISTAAEQACRAAFALGANSNSTGAPDATVRVVVSDFPDRVEVAIEPAAARGSSNTTAEISKPQDRIEAIRQRTKVHAASYETRGGRSRILLTEYLKT